ncbi:MFS general substrate transporter, partial [Marasmius fiardii PR-910]
TLMGLVKNYPQLVGLRVLLGVAEAGLFPGVSYYLTFWYPRHMLQFRIGLFFGSASLAGAFSGLLAFGISFMSGTQGLLGWSWIFILEGIATVVVGIAAFLVLVDFPETARFLTPEERAYVIWRKKFDNSPVGEEEKFSVRYIKDALTDWQASIRSDLLEFEGPISLRIDIFGYPPAISNLLTVPPYVVATTALYIFAHFSDKWRLRSPFIYAALILCLIGFSINIADVPHGVKYFGTFLVVTGSYAGFPGIVAWLSNNLSGQYKRAVGMALQVGIGNFSGAIASNVYRDRDKPRFIVGHGIELMLVGMGLITVPFVVLTYHRINNKKRAILREEEEKGVKRSPEEIRAVGDRAPEFQYTL